MYTPDMAKRVIQAKYEGKCLVCGKSIEAGLDYIEWEKGKGASHAQCVDPTARYVQCPYCYGAGCESCRERGFLDWRLMSEVDRAYYNRVNEVSR